MRLGRNIALAMQSCGVVDESWSLACCRFSLLGKKAILAESG
jgi:hypothetical protein